MFAGARLLAELLVPAFTNYQLTQDMQSFSIIGAAFNLGRQDSTSFMLIILVFSMGFPATKLMTMFLLWLLFFVFNVFYLAKKRVDGKIWTVLVASE